MKIEEWQGREGKEDPLAFRFHLLPRRGTANLSTSNRPFLHDLDWVRFGLELSGNVQRGRFYRSCCLLLLRPLRISASLTKLAVRLECFESSYKAHLAEQPYFTSRREIRSVAKILFSFESSV